MLIYDNFVLEGLQYFRAYFTLTDISVILNTEMYIEQQELNNKNVYWTTRRGNAVWEQINDL